jgi:Tfp pilus assembly protein FimT
MPDIRWKCEEVRIRREGENKTAAQNIFTGIPDSWRLYGKNALLSYQLIILLICLFACQESPQQQTSVADSEFIQEFHQAFPLGNQPEINNVTTIAVDREDNLWAGTRTGLFFMAQMRGEWNALMTEKSAGPVFDISVDREGTVWIAAWNGLYKSGAAGIEKIKEINQPVAVVYADSDQVITFGPDGIWKMKERIWQFSKSPYSDKIEAVIADRADGLWLASAVGLYHQRKDDFILYQNDRELISPHVTDVAYTQTGDLWVGGLGGITVYRHSERISEITPRQGLPAIEVQCIESGPDGRMWVGTSQGVTRYDGRTWSLRHSRRWLLSDDVRDIAFDSKSNAWLATAKGVSAIKQRTMTLAAKADYFQHICQARHVREPGLVEKCRLESPGDTSRWMPYDDDNDGQYTAMYLAMEAFRYAVTKADDANANARRAFDALHYLQTVTETAGFVARTVIPADWKQMADPNRVYTEQEWARIRVHNPREKRVEKRWRPSRDGKWLWKGDTSSDEITGHMYGYYFYYELVADETEKKRVSEHVCNIVDYLIDNGYNLVDIDGKHTKWAVWSPQQLNGDPDWRTERGINSLEILSYLKLARHMSAEEKYQKHYLILLHDHHYLENIKQVKTMNPAWRTHIDDELLALVFPVLLQYEKDPELLKAYYNAFEQWYTAAGDDCSPYFNFMYGAFKGADPHLDCSINNLRDTPLDLVRWRVDNTHREDLDLTRYPEYEHIQTSRLVAVSERGVMRWDNNPWVAVQGDGGYTESDGVYWLLPYWMGRYYGFISEAE